MSNIDALNIVLAGEYAAIYAYGVIGAHLKGAEETRALTVMAGHRQKRDQLRAKIIAGGGTPVAAAAIYDLPAEVSTSTQARELAALVEDRLSGQWAGVAAASIDADRATAALVAVECSVRSTSWNGKAPIWPGAS
ncbi:MAG: ferritin-like domain-containing protein [Actinomycetes bacterium]